MDKRCSHSKVLLDGGHFLVMLLFSFQYSEIHDLANNPDLEQEMRSRSGIRHTFGRNPSIPPGHNFTVSRDQLQLP